MRPDYTFGHYMVGVFDVLGQSTKLHKQGRLSLNDSGQQQHVIDNLKSTAGVVISYRQMFKDYFESAAGHSDDPRLDLLRPHQRAEMLAAKVRNIIHWGASDAIYVAIPLTHPIRHPVAPIADVFHSFVAAASMWLLGLSTNHPLRGGMEIGLAIDIEPGKEVYGHALEAAYHLESTVAKLPRIVVGAECVEFLKLVKRDRFSPDNRSQLPATMAGMCLSMLRQDFDGCMVVDGLGSTMLRQAVSRFRDAVLQAHDNVRANHQRFRDTGNEKLATRYKTLLAYFDESAPKWRIAPEW